MLTNIFRKPSRSVSTNQGTVSLRFRKNGDGILDKAASTCFTWGQCHSFAAAMHDKTGWPIIGIAGNPGGTPGHFVIYSPNIDDYIDIDGPLALERYPWLKHIREYDRKELPPRTYRPLDVELAKPFVNSVLQKIDKLPVKHSTEKAMLYLNSPDNKKAVS